MAITDNIKDILSIKIKPRQDSYTDQFCRILMVKILMIGTLLVGLSWYGDKMTCIIPGSAGISGGFVSIACWINGLYVYKDVQYHDGNVGYYGIPRDINNDGMMNGEVCSTTDTSHRKVENCIAMEKTFYLQYQYMTFLLLGLVLLYYSPYALFRWNNDDKKSLGDLIESGITADDIVGSFFNNHVISQGKMRVKIVLNLVVKVLYIVASVAAFVITDGVWLGEFASFGNEWISWAKLPNALSYDYMGKRVFAKAGDVVFPTFGLCEVHESAQDIKHVITNKHRFVCEISQHVLYQYVFITIWFAMIASILVSSIGLTIQILSHAKKMLTTAGRGRKMGRKLSLRHHEYLDLLERKNMPLYSEVLRKLNVDPYYMVNNEEKGQMDSMYI